MSLPLAPLTIFRARAIAPIGEHWLADGFHFRVKVHPWLGFPLHPFAAWRLFSLGEEVQPPIVWRNRDGKTITMPFDIQGAGGEVVGTVITTTGGNPWVWIEFEVDDRGMRIDLLDSKLVGTGDRILMSRTHGPYAFGDGELLHFRVTGDGRVMDARGIQTSTLTIEDIGDREPDFTFGLPIRTNEWYAEDPAVDAKDAAYRRVRSAAPTHLSPPDNPTGAIPDGTDPDAETDRIMNIVGPQLVEPWLTEGWSDPHVPPSVYVHSEPGQTPHGKQLKANAPITPSLFTMSVDPQVARYLGLATMVDYSETPPMKRKNLWLIASRWAVQQDRIVRPIDAAIASLIPNAAAASVPLSAFLGSAGSVPPFVNSILDGRFSDAPGIIARLPEVPDREHRWPWTAVTVMALAVAPGEAPPDPPDPFELSAFEPGTWNAQPDPDVPGPETWRQSISLGARPSRGMVGFVRNSPGEPVALHQVVPEGQPEGRVLPLVPNWASNNERLVTDRLIPPDPAGASWTVWQADEFGQWSDGAPYAAPLAGRPRPPVPVAEVTYAALPDDYSEGMRLPGTIAFSLEVPILAKSAPGSLPVATLDVTVDGVAQPSINVTPGETLRRAFQPRPFGVGEHRTVAIAATYSDGVQTSPPEILECGVFDARAPKVVPTSPLVIWAGQPDATGHAELALKWPPRVGAERYRVYLGDLRRLAGDAHVDLSGSAVRATDAKPVHEASATFVDKHLFTFLGETSGTPAGDGKIHYSTRIPALLRGLQFVRIVPITHGGAESSFARCGLVPVAVPGIDRPAPPAVVATADPAVGVKVTVLARGFRQDLLDAGGGKPPEYRVRRTRRANANRDYIPLLPEGGALSGPDAEGVWTAGFTTPVAKIDLFVRYRWFAEIRYPPEPPLPPGVVAEPVDGGVEPLWTTLGSDSEAVWSDPSLATESLLIPEHGPQPPEAPTVSQLADGAVRVHVGSLPEAAPDAIGFYGLEIYRVQGAAAPVLVATAATAGGEVDWTDASPTPPTDRYALVVVDPIGRRSPPTFADPPPP